MTYVAKRPNKEAMYLQSFKAAQRIATDEAARGTVVGRIRQDGSLGIIKAKV